jgi:hypothetical protein
VLRPAAVACETVDQHQPDIAKLSSTLVVIPGTKLVDDSAGDGQ